METSPSSLVRRGHEVFSGGGEMGALMESIDWSNSSVGPIETWSQALRTTVGLLLRNRFPILLWWGPRFVQFYNDAYRPIPGQKHPRSMGQPASECWREIWHIIAPMVEQPYRGEPATTSDDLFLLIDRKGFLEETHFKVAYSPVPDDSVQPTGIGGVLATVAETTEQVYGERQLRTLRELGARAAEAKTAEEACEIAGSTLRENSWDVPFALIYLLNREGNRARLASSVGFEGGDSPAAPAEIDLSAPESSIPWPLGRILAGGKFEVVSGIDHRWGALPAGRWSRPPHTAVVLPLSAPEQAHAYGVLVCGVSPHRALDEGYRGFFELGAQQVMTAIRNARALEEERSRAEALAEIDRAKTTFFSNVSHEFRTPLTLLLGPLEEVLSRENPDGADRGRLETAHRNALRLLKLVNSLLDFSRIEAGRVQASYEPSDLAQATCELASVFRSAIEKAGLRLIVDCPPLAEPVWIDREMWEKVVLNLLSNAFKFTFEGEIEVRLRRGEKGAELSVRDTGTGVPESEVPRLFERFHRVVNTPSRTHEGSGIGLALVQELVRLHGGTVRVETLLGRGTTFTVTLPFGNGHLPPDRFRTPRGQPSTAIRAEAFVEEALRWLPGREEALLTSARPPRSGRKILVADDNADMREYVARILRTRWELETVSNGREALRSALANPPDLVLTDVMMPELDGFELLRELRAHASTKTLPVILLSARAGEESRIEGLEAGADDYLTKPFTARELVARVEAHLELSRLRRASERSEEKLRVIADAIPALISYVDAQGRYVFVNKAYETWFGRPLEEVQGKLVREVLGEEAYKRISPYMERALRGLRASFEVEAPYKNGGTRFVEATYIPDANARGEAKGIFVLVLDITEKRRRLAALEAREETLRIAAQIAKLGHWEVDLRTLDLDCSDSCKLNFGSPPEAEFTYATVFERIHPEDRPRVSRTVEEAIKNRREYYAEYRVVWPSREIRWIAERGRATYDADGTPLRMLGVTLDVSESHYAQAALRESEERFRAIVTQTLCGVAQTDLTGRFVFMNDRYCEITGRSREELLNLKMQEITHPQDLPGSVRQFEAMVRGEGPFEIVKRYIRPDGSQVWVHNSVSLLRDRDARPASVVAMVLDVTARRQAEEKLRESEARFRNMADSAPVIIWVAGPDGECSFLSKFWYEFSGQAPEAGLGFGWTDAVYPDDREAVAKAVRAASETREPFRLEFRVRRKDGEYRWVIDSAIPRFGPGGDFLGWIGSVTDITDRKRAEDEIRARVRERTLELARTEARFRSMVESIPGAVYRCDLAQPWAVHYMSEAVFEITGHLAREFVDGGLTRDLFIHPEDKESVKKALEIAAANRQPYHLEYRLPHRDGTIRWVLDRGYIIFDESGHPRYVEGVVLDVTEQRRTEESLRNRTSELEEAVRELESFTYTIAHDLRSPLRGLYRYSDVLREEYAGKALDETGQEYTLKIAGAAQKMDRLIEDLLAYSRITRTRIEFKVVDLQALLEEILRGMEGEIREKKAKIVLEGVLPAVEGDPVLLAQAFTNLLSNALKFVPPERSPEVRIHAEPAGVRTRIIVEDQGIGISPEHHGKVFQVFERLHSAIQYPGTGIGLAIVKKAVERSGGKVGVDSEAGRGSKFWVELALAGIRAS